jgi:hypothetical protein
MGKAVFMPVKHFVALHWAVIPLPSFSRKINTVLLYMIILKISFSINAFTIAELELEVSTSFLQ